MNFKIIIMYILMAGFFLGCNDFLDIKPDKKLVVPETLADIQAILNRIDVLNMSTVPEILEFSADNYYLTTEDWNSLSLLEDRSMYLWEQKPLYMLTWIQPYRAIFYANTALDQLDKIIPEDSTEDKLKEKLEGIALFYRGYYYFKLAQVFASSYAELNFEKPGIVIREDSDLNKASKRSTVRETYKQIETDLIRSSLLLKPYSIPKYATEPSLPAAYAALAKLYLSMEHYDVASLYADSCLSYFSSDLDFNTLDEASPNPFERYNKDVIFYTSMVPSQVSQNMKVSEELYDLYSDSDIRKKVFYSISPQGQITFKGNYNQNASSFFSGITVGDIILTQAECNIRTGNTKLVRTNLVRLLNNRYYESPNIEGLNEAELLSFILDERRREMAFKGERWNDIRRGAINEIERPLTRRLDNNVVTFRWDEFNYAHLIPEDIIQRAKIDQNVN